MATPTTTIDALPAATAVTGSQLVIIQETGVTKKVTVDELASYLNTQVTGDVVWVGTDEPPDDDMELWYDVDATGALSSMTALTVDTEEAYRVILFSNGNVRAIPIGAVPPSIPTGLARVPRINSVRLTWAVPAGAATYAVYRNGAPYAIASTNSYRDRSVTVGATYTYAVQAISSFGLRSAITDTVSAFIDPALNIAPTVEVRTWAGIPVYAHSRSIVRVNASDADAQVLAYTLGVDIGSLIATADPSVWILVP